MSRRASWRVVPVAIVAAVCGCDSSIRFRDLEAFETYARAADSAFVVTQASGDVTFSLRYLPTDALLIAAYREYLQAAQRLRAADANDAGALILQRMKQELAAQRAAYDRSLYFRLSIQPSDRASRLDGGELNARIQRMLARMQDRISLQTARIAEVPLQTYHVEESFGLRPQHSVLLVFPKQLHDGVAVAAGEQRRLELSVRDFGLMAGTVTFEYPLPLRQASFDLQE